MKKLILEKNHLLEQTLIEHMEEADKVLTSIAKTFCEQAF